MGPIILVPLAVVLCLPAHICVLQKRRIRDHCSRVGGVTCVLQNYKLLRYLRQSVMACRLAVLVCDRLRTCVDGKKFVVMVLLTVLACVIAHICMLQRSKDPAWSRFC